MIPVPLFDVVTGCNSQIVVVVEHIIRSLKIFRILAERYRNRRKRFRLCFTLIAGLHKYELGLG